MAATSLLAIIDGFRNQAGLSDPEFARRVGMTRQALHLWRSRGLRALPTRDILERVSTVTGMSYRHVLSAALVDAGYLRVGQAVISEVQGAVPAAGGGQVLTGAQIRDLFREDFEAWTGTPVAITDPRGRAVAQGPLARFVSVSEKAFYRMQSGSEHEWSAADRCTVFGAHPPVPESLAGGRSGTTVAVADLRIGDDVTAWRGTGLRILRVVGMSRAVDPWGDVRIDFVDNDSGETITHPNMTYNDIYTVVG